MLVATGASGHVGGPVADELSRRPILCRAVTRDPVRPPGRPCA